MDSALLPAAKTSALAGLVIETSTVLSVDRTSLERHGKRYERS